MKEKEEDEENITDEKDVENKDNEDREKEDTKEETKRKRKHEKAKKKIEHVEEKDDRKKTDVEENEPSIKAKASDKLTKTKPSKDLYSIFEVAKIKSAPAIDIENDKINKVPKNNTRCRVSETNVVGKPVRTSKFMTVTKDIRYRVLPSLEKDNKQIKINVLFKPTNQLEDVPPDQL